MTHTTLKCFKTDMKCHTITWAEFLFYLIVKYNICTKTTSQHLGNKKQVCRYRVQTHSWSSALHPYQVNINNINISLIFRTFLKLSENQNSKYILEYTKLFANIVRQDCLLHLYYLCPEMNLSQWSFGCYQQQYHLKCIILWNPVQHQHFNQVARGHWRNCRPLSGIRAGSDSHHAGCHTQITLANDKHTTTTTKKKVGCSLLTEMKMFRRFSRVGSWGMSFCTTLLKASKMEWS